MKIIFRIVGALTGILLIFFFLQYSIYAIFPMGIDTVLDCRLDKGIASGELADLSQKNKITTFTTVYDSTSFSNVKINFNFLNVNPNDHIRFGLQKSLLPTTQVNYAEQGGADTYIQHFWAVESEGADFDSLIDELKDNLPECEQFYPVKLSLPDVLNVQNRYFFMSSFFLLLFCSFAWLYTRCEEITASELHEGKAFKEIKPQLIGNVRQIAIPYLLIGGVFGAYVLLRNSSLILDYIKTFIAFGLILLAAQMICGHLAFAIVQKTAVSSLTGKKRRGFSAALLLAFAIIAAGLFAVSSQNTYFNVMNITMFQQGASAVGSFSYIQTSKIPDEASMEQLLSVFDEINMDNVYSYAHPTRTLLGYRELRNREARDQMYRNAPLVRMSYNMLDFVPIYGSNDVRLKKEDFNQEATTLLLPDHLKENTDDILQNFYDGQSFEVRYIQSNQEHFDILDPSQRVLNAMYMLTPVEKNIYYTNGEVLFDEKAIPTVEQKLADYGFDQGTISLKKLSVDYGEIEDELKLALIGDGLLWFMNAAYFFTAVISCGTAFCGLRKRKIYR